MKFRRKNIFDFIEEGKMNDAVLAGRMKLWMSGRNVSVARRTIKLYDKQPPEMKASLEKHGLTKEFVEKHRHRVTR